ncbi:MAG TPA: type II secretion system F family protein, partial [Sulfuricaulis sp.]|nr:type II secretion system F family protein [Sulfuricaulis sp.]
MAAFEYQALNPQGHAVKGVMEGDAERQVRALLREKGLTPLRVDVIDQRAEAARSKWSFSFRRGIPGSELALLTRQFATLIHAGLTIEECLNALIEQTESARSRSVLAGVRTRVLEGQSLSRGLAQFPESFPEIFRSMVDAGEQSGRLDEVLERLADYTESRQSLQQKVQLAFIYPALVTLVATAVVVGLLVYVVPQVTRVFENTGQTLPLVTRILIAVSDFARGGGWWWLVVVVAAIVAFRAALREPHL